MHIDDMAGDVHKLAKEKGWWDGYALPLNQNDAEIIATKLMLVVTELAEAMEEIRDERSLYYTGEDGKPEGFAIELADAAIRLFDLAEACGFDIEDAMRVKHEYNKTRKHRHGGRRV